jgi:hypothetical protein
LVFRKALARACHSASVSGTLFASHKLPLKGYLAAIAIFCNEVKGKAALALSRDLGTSYKTSFVLAHKLREAMAEELKGRVVGGEGKVAEVDGGYFGGYVKPANHRENRRDRRLARNQTGKRKVVVIVRERNGQSVPAVFRTEGQAQSWIKARIAKGTTVNADEATSWDSRKANPQDRKSNRQEQRWRAWRGVGRQGGHVRNCSSRDQPNCVKHNTARRFLHRHEGGAAPGSYTMS